MRIQNSIIVNRPIEEVFAVMTDVTNTPKWAAAAEREWWVTPPPHGVGSVRRAVGTAYGRRFENDLTVTEYDPPRRGAMAGEPGGMPFHAGIDFEPVAEGTRVTVTATIELRGPFRFAGPMVSSMYNQMWKTDLATFKRLMEAGELP